MDTAELLNLLRNALRKVNEANKRVYNKTTGDLLDEAQGILEFDLIIPIAERHLQNGIEGVKNKAN